MTHVVAPTLSDRLLQLAIEATRAAGGIDTLIVDGKHTVLGAVPRPLDVSAASVLLPLCQRVADGGVPEARSHVELGEQPEQPGPRLSDGGKLQPVVRAYAAVPILDGDGGVLGALCVIDHRPHHWSARELTLLWYTAELVSAGLRGEGLRVVTAQHRAAERNAAFLDALLESLDTAVVACDAEGRVVLRNRAQRELDPTIVEGMTADEWNRDAHLSRPDGRPLPADDMPLVRALHGQATRAVDFTVDRGGGDIRVISVNVQPITAPDGERLGAVAASHDVTQQRRTERLHICETAVARALAPATAPERAIPGALEALVRNMKWARAEFWRMDPLTGVLRLEAHWTTPEFASLVVAPQAPLRRGAGLPGAAWQTSGFIWAPELIDEDSPVVGGALRSAIAVPVRGDPDLLGVLTTYMTSPEEPDEALSTLLSGVAAHIGQFAERRRAEELALRLVRAKDEYIALVGHQLRTPLTSIAAYASLIEECPDNSTLGELRHLLEVVKRNTRQLREVVDDLLDLAALDSGHVPLERAPVDLVPLVKACVDALASEIEANDVALTTRLPERLTVTGDRVRLRQLLDNIVANAILYTPGGRVEVTCAEADDTALIWVVDTGIGISEAERELVTRRFFRGQSAIERGLGGHGLGLAISGIIVERHGGIINLTPTEGGGTTVEIRLPRPVGA